MSDTVLGVLVLIPFMILVFAAGFVLQKFKNARFVRAWEPLVPILGGKVVQDGGGGAASWLTGKWNGRKAWAKMAPKLNRSSEGGDHYNHFEAGLEEVPGAEDWSVLYGEGFLGMGRKGWHVKTKDPALAARLETAGVLGLISPFGGTASYDARQRRLLYREDVTPRWAPEPERFRQQLALLERLAAANEEANLPRGA